MSVGGREAAGLGFAYVDLGSRPERGRADQAVLCGVKRQLGVRLHLELVQQARAIRRHRFWRKAELPADRRNRPAGREHPKDLELAVGELVVWCGPRSAQAVRNRLCHRGTQVLVARHDALEGADQLFGRGLLGEIAGSDELEHASRELILGKHRENQYRQRGPGLVQLAQHVEAVAIGQAEIEQYDVPGSTERKHQRLGGAAGFAELEPVGKALENLDQSAADEGVVVDDEDAIHRGGNHAVTRVPPLSRGATSSTPPSAAARSRMPRMPSEPGPDVAASVIPRPSSKISSVTHSPLSPSRISTCAAPAWREMFVSPSCTMRNRAVARSCEIAPSVAPISA